MASIYDLSRRHLAAGILTAFAMLAANCADGQTPGSFDASFAAGAGISRIQMGDVSSEPARVVVQRDGRIIVSGKCSRPQGGIDFCIARLTADGEFDQSFGTGGRVELNYVSVYGAFGLALQSDGAILIAGYCFSGGRFVACLARLRPDGNLDASFVGPDSTGSGRIALPPLGVFFDSATAIIQQPDGKIVVAGTCTMAGSQLDEFCVTRLMPNGTLDSAFDGPGGAANGTFSIPMYSVSAAVTRIALLPDGKIVLAGSCRNGVADTAFCATRLHPDGRLDTAFADGGRIRLRLVGTQNQGVNGLAIQADSKIILGGYCENEGVDDLCIARLNAQDGSLDASFNKTGIFVPQSRTPNMRRLLMELKVQADGKIFVAGICAEASSTQSCATRLHSDGTIDHGFGVDGWSFWDGNLVRDAALQPGGKWIVLSSCRSGLLDVYCVSRLQGGQEGGQECKPDVDADGNFTAAVDALIYARVALGVRGPQVIAGIVFPPAARRNTWSAIRDYLNSQCGLNVF